VALFKVYYGDKDSLPEEIKDGYGYVVVNEEANIGTWYIDVNPDNDENGKRYEISAAELVDEEGNFYTLDDIALIANLKADILDAIYDS